MGLLYRTSECLHLCINEPFFQGFTRTKLAIIPTLCYDNGDGVGAGRRREGLPKPVVNRPTAPGESLPRASRTRARESWSCRCAPTPSPDNSVLSIRSHDLCSPAVTPDVAARLLPPLGEKGLNQRQCSRTGHATERLWHTRPAFLGNPLRPAVVNRSKRTLGMPEIDHRR